MQNKSMRKVQNGGEEGLLSSRRRRLACAPQACLEVATSRISSDDGWRQNGEARSMMLDEGNGGGWRRAGRDEVLCRSSAPSQRRWVTTVITKNDRRKRNAHVANRVSLGESRIGTDGQYRSMAMVGNSTKSPGACSRSQASKAGKAPHGGLSFFGGFQVNRCGSFFSLVEI